MTKGITIETKKAKETIDRLRSEDKIDLEYKIVKEKNLVLIPVNDNYKEPTKNLEFTKKEKKLDFREEVLKILTKEEQKILKTAYDTIGTIAVLEIDEPLKNKAKDIAKILLKTNPQIKTVVKKKGEHKGELRIQEYEILAGEKTLLAKHKENNCIINVELDKVYYSPRSATERKRVAGEVKTEEKVLVMFSGCAPFVCVISKNTKAKEVLGIELNKEGHELGLKNVKANKLTNAKLLQGDVREICPKLKEDNQIFDRIIMPLPKTAEEFLPEAFLVSKKGTTIHLYDFVDEREFPENVLEKIEKYAKAQNIKYKMTNHTKCGQFAPYIFRVCVDFKII